MVPANRLARVLQTSESRVLELARGMGLRVPPKVESRWLERGYCTIIRANWHLLPYEQLMELLDWDAQRLAFVLKEEDFLWFKLGKRNPGATPIHDAPLTAKQQQQTAWLKTVVEKHFPDLAASRLSGQRPFAFLDDFRRAGRSAIVRPGKGAFDLRLGYSYSAIYGDCFLDPRLDPYPDGLLARLAEQGANAVWLPALLYTLFPWKPAPDLSEGYKIRLRNLRSLAKRIARRGMGLYLYLNEPRGLPSNHPLFARHPEWRGVVHEHLTALCTSCPPILDFVREGTAQLFRAAPELAGVMTITMSEFLTNCHSKGNGGDCPRCAKRTTQEVVAGVNRAVAEGARSAKPDARVIVWTWAWKEEWEHAAVDLLPEKVDVMCVSEWGLPLRGGKRGKHCVVDYSISQVGPSQRSVRLWKHARRRGLGAMAKVQLNNSWELCSVPYLPVADLVEKHLKNLKKTGVNGLMFAWTLGGYPGGNLGLMDRSAKELAEEQFGVKAAPFVRKAWHEFSRAFRQFPFSCPVIYFAPHNAGPMNLLHAKPTGYEATMVYGFSYDDLRKWRDFYPEGEFERRFRKMSGEWRKGLVRLEAAEARVDKAHRRQWIELKNTAMAAYCHFRSAFLQIRFIRQRKAPPAIRAREWKALLDEEIHLAKTLHDLVKKDSLIGFEAANHYSCSPNDLREKVLNCEHLLSALELGKKAM